VLKSVQLLPLLLPRTHESRRNAQKRYGDQHLTLDDVTNDVGSTTHLSVIYDIYNLSPRQPKTEVTIIFENYYI